MPYAPRELGYTVFLSPIAGKSYRTTVKNRVSHGFLGQKFLSFEPKTVILQHFIHINNIH